MDGTSQPEFDPVMADDEPLRPFDVHESSERAGLIKLLAAGGILLALALIVMKVYQPGTRARTDPPLITAENTPFKVVPEDLGGVQAPDQDKEVFEVMSGERPSTDVVTLPAPEVPISLPQDPEPEAQPAPDPAPALQTPEPVAPAPRPAPAPAPAAQRPAPQAQAPAPSASGGSDWVGQVASLRTQAEADRTAAAVRAANASILSGRGFDIRRVDLADKGIYYRARVDGFASKADASATCDKLKAAGQACFVTRR